MSSSRRRSTASSTTTRRSSVAPISCGRSHGISPPRTAAPIGCPRAIDRVHTRGVAVRTNAQFREADFTGARFRTVNFSQVKINDALLLDVDISGLVGNVTINGIEVGAYVRAEHDTRH